MPKLPQRKHLPHETPPWVRPGETFFITICAADRATRPFAKHDIAQSLLASARHYHDTQRWWIRLFLVMPDHLHALLAFPPAESMKKVVEQWKSYTSKTIGIRWQRDFFDHRPRELHALEEKETYILNNPVRSQLVVKPEDWPWLLRRRDLV